MKTSIIIHFLALNAAVNAQSAAQKEARKEYKSICGDDPVLDKTFDDGYKVSYTCDQNGDHLEAMGPPTISEDPDECAKLCQTTKGCKASAWLYVKQECYLFKTGEPDASKPVNGAVFMKRETPEAEEEEEDKEEADEADAGTGEDCENDLQSCNSEKDDVQEDLDECLEAKEICDDSVEQCESSCKTATTVLENELATCKKTASKVKTLEAELKTCKKTTAAKTSPLWERRRSGVELCAGPDQQVLSGGKWSYRAFCGRHNTKGTGPFYRQENMTVQQCIEACSKDTKCKSITFNVTDTANCKMFTAGGTHPVAAQAEDSCPRGFAIALMPTTPK